MRVPAGPVSVSLRQTEAEHEHSSVFNSVMGEYSGDSSEELYDYLVAKRAELGDQDDDEDPSRFATMSELDDHRRIMLIKEMLQANIVMMEHAQEKCESLLFRVFLLSFLVHHAGSTVY
jgi:hypothetical protein